MRPRTEIEREVVRLSAELPPITQEQEKWAYDKVFKGHLYRTKKYSACFECGHKWDNTEGHLMVSVLGDTCPKCGTYLKLSENRKHRQRYRGYFQILTTHKGYQVLRCFHLDQWCELEKPADYSSHEIYQHWVHPTGKMVVMAIKVNPMGSFYSPHAQWVWGSEMEVRNWHDRYFINDCPVYPRPKILPVIRRNGFKGNYHGFNRTYFFHLLLSSPMAETLLKAGQIKLVRALMDYEKEMKKYWPSIKVAMRHKYKIEDPRSWFDYLSQMQRFGMDIHNPKYICSPNFEADHQRLTNRIIAIRKREAEKERKARRLEEQHKYEQMKARFFELQFSNGLIDVVVLKTIDEFEAEGKELNHCLYAQSYYNKQDSLILSARRNGKRLETIEFDLETMRIKQCAGKNNKPTKHHKEIMTLLKSNIKQIRKAKRQVA